MAIEAEVLQMRILVDIGHPAHVHFFKNFIWEMGRRGHELVVTARDKDVALGLLKEYGFGHTVVGRMGKGRFNLVREWIGRERKIYSIALQFHPDILTGIHNPCVAHVARLTGAKSIIFTDAPHAAHVEFGTNSPIYPKEGGVLGPLPERISPPLPMYAMWVMGQNKQPFMGPLTWNQLIHDDMRVMFGNAVRKHVLRPYKINTV